MSGILIVDDEPANLDLLECILQSAGHVVRTASGGIPALQMAREMVPDLVLLDVMMPGMSGFEVCARLRNDLLTARAPIVFVTAMGEFGQQEQAAACGADDFLFKPVQAAEVLSKVEASLALRALRGEMNQLLGRLHALELERHAHRCRALARVGADRGPARPADGATESAVVLLAAEGAERDFYAALLRTRGIRVVEASGGAEGLALASQGTAMVIMDLWPEPQAALAALLQLRRQSRELPVVVLVPSPDAPEAIAALEAGADDCFAKGLHHDRLLVAVRRALRRPVPPRPN